MGNISFSDLSALTPDTHYVILIDVQSSPIMINNSQFADRGN